MTKTYFPESFISKYKEMLGSEWDSYFSTLQQKIPKSAWINSNKTTSSQLKEILKNKNWKFKELEFSEQAIELEDIARPGNELEFKNGLFNLQEKAAMLPALALEVRAGETILDACAAPGNKTIQLSNLSGNNPKELIAVEKNVTRFKSLKYNMRKFNVKNCRPVCMDFFRFNENNVDKILLDTPCSSEGYVRKEYDALKQWSPKLVEAKSKLQKSLIQHAFELVKKNGILVYSTCSFSLEENELVVESLLKNNPSAKLLPMKFEGFKIREGLNGLKECARIYPQDNNTQPFFIAKIQKKA